VGLLKTCELKTNDMLVVYMPDTASQVSAVAALRGHADDPEWLDGAAHLAEHVLCRASNTYDDRQVNLLLEKLFGGSDGDDIRVYTTWTETVYGHDQLYTRAMMKEAFLLMASLVRDGVLECHNMRGRLYDLKGLLVERAAVHNETRMYRDDAPRRISDHLYRLLYRDNPVRRPGDADIAQMRKLTKVGRLKQWMAGQYVPANLAVFLLGLGETEALQWVAETGLDQLKGNYVATPPADSHGDSFPQLDGIRETIVPRAGISQTHVGLAWPTSPLLAPDQCALEVLTRIVKSRTEGMLREENTDIDAGVYHPAAIWYSTRLHGMLEIWFSTVGNETYVEFAQASVLAMLRGLKDDTSTAFSDEVGAISFNLQAACMMERKLLPGVLLERAVTHAANGDRDLVKLEARPALLAAVTPAMVREAAGRYLDPDRFVRAVIRPVFVSPDDYDRAPEDIREKYLKHLLRPAE
jgi:predicted Zn-dependent peptidase